MTLVAPDKKITGSEALAFVAAFFGYLAPFCQFNIHPQIVLEAMEENNHPTGNKMKIRAVS